MKIKFPVDDLPKFCVGRADGFRAAVLRAGQIDDSRQFCIESNEWQKLARIHFLPPALSPAPTRGLGDLIAAFAEPIARASDVVLGTKLVGCQSCAERREALNKLVPKL